MMRTAGGGGSARWHGFVTDPTARGGTAALTMLALMASSPHDSSGPSGSPVPGVFAVGPAGGAGCRLGPRARAGSPKVLLDLTGSGRSLLQATVDRLVPLAG